MWLEHVELSEQGTQAREVRSEVRLPGLELGDRDVDEWRHALIVSLLCSQGRTRRMTPVRNRFLTLVTAAQIAIASFPGLAISQNAAPATGAQTDEAWQIV